MLFRSASIEESRRKLQLDLYYIKHMSFLLDVYIMARTVKTILFGRERKSKRQAREQRDTEPMEVETQMLDFETATGQEPDAKPVPKILP